jgi:predicted transcriptional regulator
MNIELTQLETQVLKSLISKLYAEAGFSDVDAKDIANDINVSIKSVRGALGSLVKKRIIDIESTNTSCAEQYELIYLSPAHYYLHPEWKNEREWNNDEILINLNNNKQTKIKVMSNKTTTVKTGKRGRPTVEGSKRQAVLAMRAAKVAAGGEIKRGRPAGTKKLKVDPTVEVVLNVKAPKAKQSKADKQARLVTKDVAILNMDDLANIINDAK